jgi:uncharacterized protein (UPF0305 family)
VARKKIPSKNLKVKKSSTKISKKRDFPKEPLPPVHPWRVCPYGEHWVRKHPLRIPPSETYPGGHTVTRREHCARNPSGLDQLYPEEMQEIASQNFSNLKNCPCPLPSKFGAKGTKYDDLIAGWVQYWNEVMKPDQPLEPNLVKALIASESSFNPNKLAKPKNSNSARGLMQITNDTRKLLGGDHGDLKDHLITVTKTELNDPNVNICAGTRWLFEKRRQISVHLKRQATWVETVWEYKATKLAKTKKEAEKIEKIFNDLFEEFQKCGKP